MAKLIQDVTPPTTVKKLPSSDELIATLYIRGITIREIFGKYYEYEEHSSARTDDLLGDDERGQHGAPLTVEDAELAGLASLPVQPNLRQPF